MMNKLRTTLFSMLVILSLFLSTAAVSVPKNQGNKLNVKQGGSEDCSDRDHACDLQTALTVNPLPPGAIVINFDDVTAPCLFMDTTALRDQYAGLGVLFMGPAENDGGGIVDQCGAWGVNGYSPPNFMGLNQDGHFSNGGIPRPPETITFTNGATHVQVNTGSNHGAGQIVTMEAFDAAGISLGSDSLTLAPTVDTLSITVTGIAYVVINSPSYFMLDDLAFLVPYRTYMPLVIKD